MALALLGSTPQHGLSTQANISHFKTLCLNWRLQMINAKSQKPASSLSTNNEELSSRYCSPEISDSCCKRQNDEMISGSTMPSRFP
jgi:hypothetical protein